ncbi:hypothetical protein H2200_004770 [Cladophialophora chaetospira]|uniref:Uncharacterized protein n=1 Tax=Cladophialophora chaetospira TaxID=386627 RepID=A0AA38XDQ1_9EURO|nr:hypothetical protein H2200_004770 [Cladophialophora chaetospira]
MEAHEISDQQTSPYPDCKQLTDDDRCRGARCISKGKEAATSSAFEKCEKERVKQCTKIKSVFDRWTAACKERASTSVDIICSIRAYDNSRSELLEAAQSLLDIAEHSRRSKANNTELTVVCRADFESAFRKLKAVMQHVNETEGRVGAEGKRLARIDFEVVGLARRLSDREEPFRMLCQSGYFDILESDLAEMEKEMSDTDTASSAKTEKLWEMRQGQDAARTKQKNEMFDGDINRYSRSTVDRRPPEDGHIKSWVEEQRRQLSLSTASSEFINMRIAFGVPGQSTDPYPWTILTEENTRYRGSYDQEESILAWCYNGLLAG